MMYLKNELGVDEGLCGSDVEILRFNESEKEFIDDLKMRPRSFHNWFVLLWIEDIAYRIRWRGDWTEKIRRKL
jgi:hypothetical protein